MKVLENEPVSEGKVALLLLIAAFFLYWTAQKAVFLARAEPATGRVALRASQRPSHSRRLSGTYFYATVEFQAVGRAERFEVPAGSAWRKGRPTSEAAYRIGDPVPVLYDPKEPYSAERNAFWDLWQGPFWVLCILLAGLLANLSRPWAPRYISATRYREPADAMRESLERMNSLLDELKTAK
jgi:hypothetical protein